MHSKQAAYDRVRALALAVAALVSVTAYARADVQVMVPGASRTVLLRSGDQVPGLGALRAKLDQIYWFPDETEGRGYLFVNHEIPYPGGGLTRLRYVDGAITRGVDWIAGTHDNCSGKVSPWQTILSCEEFPPPEPPLVGHVLEVDPQVRGSYQRLTAMGRFSHESIAYDPVTGVFYLTDDSTSGVFFKFIPDQAGSLDQGQLLAFYEPTGYWIPITDMVNTEAQAIARGATTYPRLEDIAYHPIDDAFYIMVTGTLGTDSELGYVLRFDPRTDSMSRWFDGDGARLANPDNVGVDSYGNILVLEDQYEENIDRFGPNELLLIRPDRTVFRVLRGLDEVGEVTGFTWGSNEECFWVNWMNGIQGSELIEVNLPPEWNAPGSGTSVPNGEPSPPALRLNAHPNPFSSAVALSGRSASAGVVRLAVYSPRGALVRLLHEGLLPGGLLRASWDGRDDRGRRLPAGTYMVRLQAGGTVSTRKLVLLP